MEVKLDVEAEVWVYSVVDVGHDAVVEDDLLAGVVTSPSRMGSG